MATAELKEITRSISSELGGVVGGLRKAAADNQKSFSMILKDLGKHFELQTKGMSDVSDSVDQSSNKVAAKVDSTNNLLQDQLGLLSNVYSEMKNVNSNVKVLNSSLLNNNTSLLERLGSGFKGLQNVILGAAASAAPAALGLAGGMAGSFGSDIFGGKSGGQKISNPVMAKDIYSYLKEKGVSHEHAVGILANIQNESKFDSGAYNPNDVNGPSGGLFQHHDNLKTGEHRFSDMTKSAGPDWQKNWKGQIDHALREGEMQKYLSTPVSSGQQAAAEFVYKFEKPRDQQGEAEKRAANVPNVEKIVAGTSTQTTPASGGTGATPSAKTDATPASKPEPMAPGSAEQAESSKEHGGHEGIISGKKSEKSPDAGKVTQSQSGTRNMPINDKLMSVLQKAAAEAGVAVDITSGAQPNYPQGPRTGSTRHDIGVGAADLDLMQNGRVLTDNNPEDVKIKRKFVEAAASAGATGIGAGEGYMGASKIHVGFGKPATWGGAGWLSGLNLGSATSPESETGTSGATPYSGGSAVTPGMGGGSYDQRLATIQENINKLGGGVTGVGSEQAGPTGPSLQSMQMGIPAHGMMAMPVNVQSFVENIKSQQMAPPAAPAANIVPTEIPMPAQTIDQSRLNDEVEKHDQRQKLAAFAEQTKKQTTDIVATENASGLPSSYNYNNANDVGWPDWAALIGGWHWEETKKIKQNMHF